MIAIAFFQDATPHPNPLPVQSNGAREQALTKLKLENA